LIVDDAVFTENDAYGFRIPGEDGGRTNARSQNCEDRMHLFLRSPCQCVRTPAKRL